MKTMTPRLAGMSDLTTKIYRLLRCSRMLEDRVRLHKARSQQLMYFKC